MAKEIRSGRTQVQTPGLPAAPSERSKLVAQPVPEFKSSRLGLDGLSQSFANFFGATSKAAETLMQAVELGDRKRIEQENMAQKRQAVGDALTGKAMDQAGSEDYDYYDTYRTVLAEKTGSEAVREFKDWYQKDFLQKTPDSDLAQARQEWAIKNLTGSNDHEFEGMSLSAFYKGTETMLGTHMESRLKAQFAKGKDNLEAVIDADAGNGSISPERIAFYIQAAQKLDPLNAHEAAPMVANALSVAVQNHPDKSQAILSVLDREGTGINGKSFAASFPDSYAKLQQKAVTSFEQTNTMAEWEAVNGLRERAMKLKEMNDDDLAAFGEDLIRTRNRYGAANDIKSLQGLLVHEADRRATEGANFAHVQQMLMGATPTDVDVLKKNLPDYMKKVMGIDNILKADPTQVSQILVKAGTVVPEDFKAQVSGALVNFDNPAGQMAAANLLFSIEKQRDQKFAANYLTDEAYRYYKHISDEQVLTNEPIEATLARVGELRRTAKPVESWAAVVGKPPGETRVEVDKKLNAAIKTTFGGSGAFGTGFFRSDVFVPPDIRERITDYAMAVVSERGAQGVEWSKAVEEAVGRMANRADVIPQNGTYVLRINDNQNDAYTENGVTVPRTKLGLEVYNPKTGSNVNTVKVYETQLDQLVQKAPFFLKNGTADDVSLIEHPFAVAKGSYAVAQNGNYRVFEPGEKVELWSHEVSMTDGRWEKVKDGKEAVIPDNETALNAMFQGRLPKGFGFVRIPLSDNKTGWMLAYRPNFGQDEGITLEEREKAFQPPAAPPPIRQVVFAPRTPSQRIAEGK